MRFLVILSFIFMFTDCKTRTNGSRSKTVSSDAVLSQMQFDGSITFKVAKNVTLDSLNTLLKDPKSKESLELNNQISSQISFLNGALVHYKEFNLYKTSYFANSEIKQQEVSATSAAGEFVVKYHYTNFLPVRKAMIEKSTSNQIPLPKRMAKSKYLYHDNIVEAVVCSELEPFYSNLISPKDDKKRYEIGNLNAGTFSFKWMELDPAFQQIRCYSKNDDACVQEATSKGYLENYRASVVQQKTSQEAELIVYGKFKSNEVMLPEGCYAQAKSVQATPKSYEMGEGFESARTALKGGKNVCIDDNPQYSKLQLIKYYYYLYKPDAKDCPYANMAADTNTDDVQFVNITFKPIDQTYAAANGLKYYNTKGTSPDYSKLWKVSPKDGTGEVNIAWFFMPSDSDYGGIDANLHEYLNAMAYLASDDSLALAKTDDYDFIDLISFQSYRSFKGSRKYSDLATKKFVEKIQSNPEDYRLYESILASPLSIKNKFEMYFSDDVLAKKPQILASKSLDLSPLVSRGFGLSTTFKKVNAVNFIKDINYYSQYTSTLKGDSYPGGKLKVTIHLYYLSDVDIFNHLSKQSMVQSDLYIFSGHSGSQFPADFKVQKEDFDQNKSQIYYFGGCRSFKYYADAYSKLKPANLDLVLTASPARFYAMSDSGYTLISNVVRAAKPNWESIISAMSDAETSAVKDAGYADLMDEQKSTILVVGDEDNSN